MKSDDCIVWHGRAGNPAWQRPVLLHVSNKTARCGYDSGDASEYIDVPQILEQKIGLLVDMLRASENTVAYTGAGLSTAAGIDDYATQADGALGERAAQGSSMFIAKPTLAHCALVELQRQRLLHEWVQQNHDGLPQKAGFPQDLMNEIHGSWFDPSNPVIQMSGTLREDLIERLESWMEKVELCLALGTSVAGMNADRIAEAAAQRGRLVMISVQRTAMDSKCHLRIYAKLDDMFRVLIKVMRIDVPAFDPLTLQLPENEDYYRATVQYHPETGEYSPNQTMLLDLSEDAAFRITRGKFAGDQGTILSRNEREGFINLVVKSAPPGKKIKMPHPMKLGIWMFEAAKAGRLDVLPIVTIQ